MERSSGYDDLAAALAELRPAPHPSFATELDERVAAGFPRRSRFGRSPFAALAARLRRFSPQRLIFATGGTALAAIAIATVLVADFESGSDPTAVERYAAGSDARLPDRGPRLSGSAGQASAANGKGGSPEVQQSSPLAEAIGELEDASPSGLNRSSGEALANLGRATHREIERSAEIGLIAEPADVADDSAQVFSAVHDVGGIVLHSTTTAGRNAGADFDLLIPSAKLGDALAAFSAIDEVRSRHEATDDITAPTVALDERLRDSRARIDSLLAQLAAAETESAMEAVEIALRGERRHAAGLRSRLDRLEQRADVSRVSLRIETGASPASNGSGWGIDDAFDDAGQILGIAAGVTVVALAVLVPLALIGLLAWLAYRAWLRRARDRALA